MLLESVNPFPLRPKQGQNDTFLQRCTDIDARVLCRKTGDYDLF